MGGEALPGLHVRRSGLAPGPDVETYVLLHGFGASSFTWHRWMPALDRRGHVLAVDLLGFGDSPMPREGPYDPEGQARLVMSVVEALASPRVTLVGHSLGGSVAMLTALGLQASGHRPHRLVMIAGAAYPQRLPPFIRCARYPRSVALALRMLGARFVVRQVMRPIVFDTTTVTEELVAGYAEPFRRPGAVHAMLAAARRIVPPDIGAITRRYPTLQVPTLLLWGRHDRVVPPRVGAQLGRALPNARLHLLERCGHVPQEERPEASLRLLESFLDANRFHD